MTIVVSPTIMDDLARAGYDPVEDIVWDKDGVLVPGLNRSSADLANIQSVLNANMARVKAFQADSQLSVLLPKLRTATAAEIDTWFSTNVTTQAQAIAVLKAVVKLLAYAVVT